MPMEAADLVGELLADPAVEGLTFSGGEPMQQACALAVVARLARLVRPVSLICFTGYRLGALRRRADPGVARLLAEVDVLIDGPYVAARDDGCGLRGSANQEVHHLTDRLRDNPYDFIGRARTTELRIDDAGVMLVGVPPPGLVTAVTAAADRGLAHTVQQFGSGTPA